ncbi:hypothetical protein [Rhizobium lusitanum]|uniref:Uncharacterized protein n=1 Tax=Rhizobium lusitanum TaxID=293958 RepID=A0A1C3USU2_9HYPH|nr:hypothetical protein [Rhizobium lusitanum]SCB18518.1 hypothetical protein GA0061101_103273 [Rhizobium lusitanum]
MFKLIENLTAWWPVKVLEPDNDNPGSLKEETFEVEFVIRSREETKAHDKQRTELLKQLPVADDYRKDQAGATAKAEKIGAKVEAHDRKMDHLVIKNWRGVFDAKENPVPFSAAALDMALNHERIRVGINRAYDEAVSNDKARVGNSNA